MYNVLIKQYKAIESSFNWKLCSRNMVIKNKMSCNTLCSCIFSVWEQYSKILHNIHFDHVIWYHNAFCINFVWKMSLWIFGICYWMCFCSRRAYNFENMVDIKNLKNSVGRQFVDFKYTIWWYHYRIFFNPFWPCNLIPQCILYQFCMENVTLDLLWHYQANLNIIAATIKFDVFCFKVYYH
jgi:hypothetical protein